MCAKTPSFRESVWPFLLFRICHTDLWARLKCDMLSVFSLVFGNRMLAWRLTCSSWTTRSVSWSWMLARPPRSRWRMTAGQVQVCKQTHAQKALWFGWQVLNCQPKVASHDEKKSHVHNCFCSLQVSMSSVMVGLARCPTRAPLCTASVCHPRRRAFYSLRRALPIPTSARHPT